MSDAAGSPPFDVVRFFSESTALVAQAASGESGLVSVRQVGDIALWALNAAGVAFVEFGPAVGRVIAAAGDARNTLGRRVESGDQRIRALLGSNAIRVGRTSQLPDGLRVTDGPSFLSGRVMLGARIAGALIAYVEPYPDADAEAARLAAMRYFAALIGQIYGSGRGLPLHAEPLVRAPAGSTVLLDAENMVCWVDPASAAILDDTAVALGAPLPMPIPGPGQIVEHDLPDGRWLQVSAKPLPGAAGTSISIRDITEARRYEQSRELFVALTSHELRTPVTVIKGYADTLNDRWDLLDDRGRRYAASILGQRASDLARLLDRLLSAVSDLGVPGVVSRFDLGAAVSAALDTLPTDVRDRLNVVTPPDLPLAWGEESSIEGVVSELVTNAGKYSPSAAGIIDIECVFDASTVGIKVSDHGIGVRPEHVERAFERFWQADTGDHRRFGGVGLGLYLVRRIVERQRGWVSLQPRPSGGTVAEVRLPRADLETEPAAVTAGAMSARAGM
jgi:two-component system, OmpR family, phosphate regulon sensor histidine kinase PhoR